MMSWQISGLFLIFLAGQATCAANGERRAINWRHPYEVPYHDGVYVLRDDDGLASKLEGAVTDLLSGLDDFLTVLRDGAPASAFKTALQALSEAVDAIFVESGQEQNEQDTMQLVSNALQGLGQEVPEEFLENPLKFEVSSLNVGLDLLATLATSIKTRLDEGANLLDEDTDESIYDAIFGIKLLAEALLANADAIDSTITYESQEGTLEELGDNDDEEDDGNDDNEGDEGGQEKRELAAEEPKARRAWCVGSKSSSSKRSSEEPKSKREWCIGWNKRRRSAEVEAPKARREWCVGHRSRRATDEAPKARREWCVGHRSRRGPAGAEAPKARREWCVGHRSRRGAGEEPKTRREWCVGHRSRREPAEDEE